MRHLCLVLLVSYFCNFLIFHNYLFGWLLCFKLYHLWLWCWSAIGIRLLLRRFLSDEPGNLIYRDFGQECLSNICVHRREHDLFVIQWDFHFAAAWARIIESAILEFLQSSHCIIICPSDGLQGLERSMAFNILEVSGQSCQLSDLILIVALDGRYSNNLVIDFFICHDAVKVVRWVWILVSASSHLWGLHLRFCCLLWYPALNYW